MNNMREIKLISSWKAANIREKFANNGSPEYGVIEEKIGTGRATCRECGNKIAKGEKSLQFCYDFTGCGSWTVVEVQIHLKPCKGEKE